MKRHMGKLVGSAIITIAIAAAVITQVGVFAQEKKADQKKPADVSVRVQIVWNDLSPVKGAKVYLQEGNKLLGETDATGACLVSVPNSSEIRAVDPKYGTSQLLHKVDTARNQTLIRTREDQQVYTVASSWPIGG